MEDKAAFLNRMKDTIKSSQIKDNELEDYFEVISNNPKQIEDIELILKQSPKINTIKEMKNGLTRSELKEMVRQQLKATLAEKKKMKDEKDKKMMNEAGVGTFTDPNFIAGMATLLGVGGTLAAALIKNLMQAKSPEEKANVISRAAGAIEKAKGTQGM